MGTEVTSEAQQRGDGSTSQIWALQPFPGPSARYLTLVQEWWQDFAEAYTEYGPGAADVTGLAGQWADLFRKVMKLKRAFWEGDASYLVREREAEILRDLISHAFMALEMVERRLPGGRVTTAPPEWRAHTGEPNPGASPSSTRSA